MVTIRPGTAADHAAAVDIYSRARRTAPSPERLTQVAQKLAQELVVVAEQDGVMAFAVAEPRREEDGAGAVIPGALHVSMFFVDPGHQRRGVGRTLLEGLADLAWGQGFRTLSVWSSTPEFYEACGLERTSETTALPDGRTAVRFGAELEAPTREVELTGDVIRLGQLLKYAGLVDTGAEAKSLLAAEGVTVNGELETRRGRQLHDGDEVRTEQDAVTVRLRAAG
jgi:ribosome-associated protein